MIETLRLPSCRCSIIESPHVVRYWACVSRGCVIRGNCLGFAEGRVHPARLYAYVRNNSVCTVLTISCVPDNARSVMATFVCAKYSVGSVKGRAYVLVLAENTMSFGNAVR